MLDGSHSDLVSMGKDSGRNTAVYNKAMKCGNYIAGNGLNEDRAIAVLLDASRINGLVNEDGESSVLASIRSGIRNGKKTPLTVPPPAVEEFTPTNADATANGSTPPADKRSVAAQLVDLAGERWQFGISTEGDPFALPLTGPRTVRMLTGSRSLRAELADAYQIHTGKVASQQALADALLTLEGRARHTQPVPLALRVAYADETAWLDLGDPLNSRAVKITRHGWQVVDEPPILFRRTALTGPLPDPDPAGDLDQLWTLLNVALDSRPVLLAWLILALFPDIPHPVAAFDGEQGTGKSTGTKIVAGLLDPSPAQLRKPPRDVDNWVTAADGSWLVGVDNVSTIPDWWSDALCRAVTGDGDVRRKLYSDTDLTVFAFRRAIILNGIDLGAVKDDLADRLLTITCTGSPPADTTPT